jgi:hypothetical protein
MIVRLDPHQSRHLRLKLPQTKYLLTSLWRLRYRNRPLQHFPLHSQPAKANLLPPRARNPSFVTVISAATRLQPAAFQLLRDAHGIRKSAAIVWRTGSHTKSTTGLRCKARHAHASLRAALALLLLNPQSSLRHLSSSSGKPIPSIGLPCTNYNRYE